MCFPVSLADCINGLKMTVLPRFLYLFVAIPIWLPKHFFIKLDKYVSSFIWNHATPRIKKICPERRKEDWVSPSSSIIKYFQTGILGKNGLAWAMVEPSSHAWISPISLLTAPLATQTNGRTFSNPVASNSIRIWVQFHKHLNLDQMNSLSPLSFNHLFAPSQTDQNFAGWHRHGLVFFDGLFDESSFLSYEALEKDHSIPRSHLFRYL